MINKAILIGNVGKVTTGEAAGSKYTKLQIATSEKYKDKEGKQVEKTEWHMVVFWNKLAEIAEQYAAVGAQVFVEGKIRYKTSEKDGKKYYFTEIQADEMKILKFADNKQQAENPEKRGKLQAEPVEESDGLPF